MILKQIRQYCVLAGLIFLISGCGGSTTLLVGTNWRGFVDNTENKDQNIRDLAVITGATEIRTSVGVQFSFVKF